MVASTLPLYAHFLTFEGFDLHCSKSDEQVLVCGWSIQIPSCDVVSESSWLSVVQDPLDLLWKTCLFEIGGKLTTILNSLAVLCGVYYAGKGLSPVIHGIFGQHRNG